MQASSAIQNRTVMQGDYLLLAPIGGEADNQVFRARARRDGRMVSVRLIVQEHLSMFGSDPILGKAEIASRLKHPALAAVEAYGREREGAWYIVSEYVEGPRLDEWADALGIPPLVDLIDMTHRVCHGLSAAHRAGISHDSLHPGNLIILPRQAQPNSPLDVKIMDLSVPSLVRPWPPHLQAAAFMAPEQLRLDDLVPSSADVRTNVYSCGALLYYLCTGGPPYPSRSLEELAAQHRDGRLIAPSKINPRIPAALEEAILRALSPDPRTRFPSTAELANALALIRLPIRLSSSARPRVMTPFSQPPLSTAAAPVENWMDGETESLIQGRSSYSSSPSLPPPNLGEQQPAAPFQSGVARQSTPASTSTSRPPLGSFSQPPPRESGVVPAHEWHGGSSSFFPPPLGPQDSAPHVELEISPELPLSVSDGAIHSVFPEEPASSPTLVLRESELQPASERPPPLEPVESLELPETLPSSEQDAAANHGRPALPSYRTFLFTHGLNLCFLGLAAVAGAALSPLAWLIAAFIEAAALWIIPDLARFRTHVDRSTTAESIVRERTAYLGQLFGLAKTERSFARRVLNLFVDEAPQDPDTRILDQKNEGVRVYRELRQLGRELSKIERLHGSAVGSGVAAHEQFLERMINRYLGLLLIRRKLAATLAEIDGDELSDQVDRLEQQLTRATPDARVVLAESLQRYRAELIKVTQLQSGLRLCWDRMEATRRQLYEIHRRVIAAPDADVAGLLDRLLDEPSLAADPFDEMRADPLRGELLDRSR
jgi:eukaryotic-like serine/threonine-protein kinase